MALVFKNFAGARLALALDAADLFAIVDDGDVFPDAPQGGEFVLVIEDDQSNKEIVRCTARSNETLSILRAQEDTTARAFPAGSWVELRYTAGSMDEYFRSVGLDGGLWSIATAGAERKPLQVRRNYVEPNAVPSDLNEGELVVQAGTSTPLLYVGPAGADNDGVGTPILPVVVSDQQPANPYNGLTWYDSGNSYKARVYHAGTGWSDIGATPLGIADPVTKTYVDAAIATTRANLWAPGGTQMLFHQNTPPAGWTRRTDMHDRVIRVVNTNMTAGGSWVISGLSGWTGATALTIAQLPYHDHGGGNHAHVVGTNFEQAGGNFGGGSASFNRFKTNVATAVSGNIIVPQGGSQGHTHGVGVAQNGSWRPAYLDMALATKA